MPGVQSAKEFVILCFFPLLNSLNPFVSKVFADSKLQLLISRLSVSQARPARASPHFLPACVGIRSATHAAAIQGNSNRVLDGFVV